MRAVLSRASVGSLLSVTESGPAVVPNARICPECETLYSPIAEGSGPVERCPKDGFALVQQIDFESTGRDGLLGRTVADRFTVVGRLGAGSMGAVYRAWQETVGRWVALKIMRYDRATDPEARARFEREARAMSQLVSPHTVTIYDFGEAQDGSVFLAMELLEGESLGSRLRRFKLLSLQEAVRVAREALLSLAEAHQKGIIHRDLKPDNLFLSRSPSITGGVREMCKLLDFGIAKLAREDSAIDALETQAGTVFGTPRYMSPEQAQGKSLDARSDLYSLGVILYQMVVGKPPFDDEDAVVVMARHIKTPAKPPREVAPQLNIPQELERVILCALAKDPKDRFPAAETFIRALDRLDLPVFVEPDPAMLSSDVAMVDDDPLPTMSSPRLKLVPAKAIGAAIIAAVGLAAAGLWVFRSGEGRSSRSVEVSELRNGPEAPSATLPTAAAENPSAGSSIPASSEQVAPPTASSNISAISIEALPVVKESLSGPATGSSARTAVKGVSPAGPKAAEPSPGVGPKPVATPKKEVYERWE
jgi:eukaryotic-like serine/threonine-protein kinase